VCHVVSNKMADFFERAWLRAQYKHHVMHGPK